MACGAWKGRTRQLTADPVIQALSDGAEWLARERGGLGRCGVHASGRAAGEVGGVAEVESAGALGDDGPGVAFEDEAAAVFAGGLAGGFGGGEELEQGVADGLAVEVRAVAGAGGFDVGVVAGVSHDAGAAAAQGLGNGHGKALLAAGQAEGGGVDDGGDFHRAVDGSDEVGSGLEAGGGDLRLEVGLGAAVRAGDDEAQGGQLAGDGGEGFGEEVEALLVVQAAEEQDVGVVTEFGVCGAEGAAGWEVGDFAFEYAVGDDFPGRGELEWPDEVSFVGVEHVEEHRAVEGVSDADGDGELFFELALGEGPGVEHAVGGEDVGDAGPAALGGDTEEHGFPNAVEMDDIESSDEVSGDAGCAGAQQRLDAGFFGEVVLLDVCRVRDAAHHGLDVVGGGGLLVGEHVDVVAEHGLRGGELDGDDRGAPGGGVEVTDDVEDSEGGGLGGGRMGGRVGRPVAGGVAGLGVARLGRVWGSGLKLGGRGGAGGEVRRLGGGRGRWGVVELVHGRGRVGVRAGGFGEGVGGGDWLGCLAGAVGAGGWDLQSVLRVCCSVFEVEGDALLCDVRPDVAGADESAGVFGHSGAE